MLIIVNCLLHLENFSSLMGFRASVSEIEMMNSSTIKNYTSEYFEPWVLSSPN